MKKITGLFLSIIISFSSFSQDASIRKLQVESLRTIKKDIPDTANKNWKTGGIYNISAGQGSLSNWAAGGDDFSFSLATSLNLYAFYKKDKTNWDNALTCKFRLHQDYQPWQQKK